MENISVDEVEQAILDRLAGAPGKITETTAAEASA